MLEDDEILRTAALASNFRAAIERCNPALLPVSFKLFPRGACGDASLLLGTFLTERGEGEFQYVLGLRGAMDSQHSHAWIERNGMIVDITADQFEEITDPVVVTNFSPWHASFSQERNHAADYRIYDDYTAATLGTAYRAIIACLL